MDAKKILGRQLISDMKSTGKGLEALYNLRRPLVSHGVRQAELENWRVAVESAKNG